MAVEKEKSLKEGAAQLGALPGFNSSKPANSSGGQSPSGKPAVVPQGKNGADNGSHPLQGMLLVPGADKKFENVRYQLQSLGREGDLPVLSSQYNQAVQAEKALKNVNDTFLNLWKQSNEGGKTGRIHRTFDPHSLPAPAGIVGDLMKGAAYAGSQMTNTDINRRYDAEQSNLKGFISAALKGTNISSGDIDDIVSKNSPEYGDSEKTMATKLKTIRDFIKNHTETSMLKTWGMTKE